MIVGGLVAAFSLGLRHGADPDHIAAIDNMTRNSYGERPLFSRFVGTLFAGGHSVMVLSIAALIGLLGSHLGTYANGIETAGTWISIVVLLAIGVVNLRQIGAGATGGLRGVRTRFIPKSWRAISTPWIAVPVGLLFGFGFETSSQIATYTISFGANSGVTGALLVGATFCFGMIVTDTLDSVLVHRLVSDRSNRLPCTMRVWIAAVTAVAFAVAFYEIPQALGWFTPSDAVNIGVSAAIVVTLFAVFAYVFVRTKAATPLPLNAPRTGKEPG